MSIPKEKPAERAQDARKHIFRGGPEIDHCVSYLSLLGNQLVFGLTVEKILR